MSASAAGVGAVRGGAGRILNFDRLARVYRWMEWLSFGPYLWRTRCTFLGRMRGARRALVLGDGDGRFTAELLRRNGQVRVHAVDVSDAMILSLRRRAGLEGSRLRTESADLREWDPGASTKYDLLVTHFFLDCLTRAEVSGLAERVKPALAREAIWVVSEFAIPDGWFGRLVSRPVVGSLYWAFRILTGLAVRRLPEWREALEDAGFVRVAEQRRLNGLLVSEIWGVDGTD